MKLQIDRTEDIAKCVYDGQLPYNTAVSVPMGTEAVYIKNGTVAALLREGATVVNGAGALKAAFTKCKDSQKIFSVNRSKPFTVLWGTGGIGYTGKNGETKVAGSNGFYRFTTDNAAALLRRFGYADTITADDVKKQLNGAVTGAAKEEVLRAINGGGYNVGAQTSAIQECVQRKLEKIFADYGLFLDCIAIEEVTDVYGGGNGEE